MKASALRLPRSDRWLAWIIGVVLALGLIVLLLWRMIFVVVPSGSVGVLYDLLFGGTQTRRVYGEGLVVKLPWNRFYLYDVRLQSRDYEVQALSAEGMATTAHVTALFRPRRERVGELQRDFGPDYVDRLVSPLVIGTTRDVIGLHDFNELYTTDVKLVKEEILNRLRASDLAGEVVFEELVLRQMTIPQPVLDAINQKLRDEQVAASYQFRIAAEQQEAERKRVEAIGIQNFYSILSNALTPELLTWRGIEATVEIARSPNSKVVIVGGGKDQMPLILGSDVGTLPERGGPAATAVGPTAGPLPDWRKLPLLFPPVGSQGLQQPSQTPPLNRPQPAEPPSSQP